MERKDNLDLLDGAHWKPVLNTGREPWRRMQHHLPVMSRHFLRRLRFEFCHSSFFLLLLRRTPPPQSQSVLFAGVPVQRRLR